VPACAPASESAPAQLELLALGDFDRSNDSVAILQSDASLRGVTLPEGTRAAELNTLGSGAFWGMGTLSAHNQLPILLWPKDRACALARIEAGAPSGSWLLGASDRLETLLVSGPDAAVMLAVDLSRGSVVALEAELGPRRARAGASLSELGDQLVLAGGVEPGGSVLGSAELFDPTLGRFTGETRDLSTPRARHAALGLGAGTTLLIGGETEGGTALENVEVLALDAPRFSRTFELLATPRLEPRVVLLGGDRILVGGGYTRAPDGARQPVASVEFLSTDLSDVADPPIPLEPAALDRAFAALGPSGALAVGGCELGAARDDCIPCDGGCVSRDVWWIDARGAAHVLEPLPTGLASPAPKLVTGASGSPWLIAGERLARFDPWLGRFETTELAGTPAARVLGEPVAIRPGLFVWLEQSATGVTAMGMFHSQRGPYAQDTAPLLVGTGRNVVPEQPPVDNDAGVRLEYRVATGLELSGPAAVASVADTTYADFTLELSLVSGPPPLLELVGAGEEDDGTLFGGIDCPWPELDANADSASRGSLRLEVQRSEGRVRLSHGDAARGEPCERVLPERVSLRLVGTPAGTSQLSRIEIRRAGE
jgi:hypothetical protein